MSESTACDDYSDDEFEGLDEDPEHEWVLDCGFKGCLMPGYHFRSECHNVQMMLEQSPPQHTGDQPK